jgi:hypothetical protein
MNSKQAPEAMWLKEDLPAMYYLNPAHLEVRKVHFHSIKWAF